MREGADGIFAAAPLWRGIVDHLLIDSPAEPFLAYAKVVSEKNLHLTDQSSVTLSYYRISTGKKISAEKAMRIGMDKVRIEKQYVNGSEAESIITP